MESLDPDHFSDDGVTDDATQMLNRLAEGDSAMVHQLLPVVYAELRNRAGRLFNNQRHDHTLQPTALVHEVYLKIIRPQSDWKNRAHFMAVASMAMRQVLSNYSRKKRAINLDVDVPEKGPSETFDAVAFDDMLKKLSALDERGARLVEMRIFGGMTFEEIAAVLDVSLSTVEKQWRRLRAWLARELAQEGQA